MYKYVHKNQFGIDFYNWFLCVVELILTLVKSATFFWVLSYVLSTFDGMPSCSRFTDSAVFSCDGNKEICHDQMGNY